MQRWTSEPLPLPVVREDLATVHLELEGVRHGGATFTVFAFLNAGGELPEDAGRDHDRFAAAFTVFANGVCWGEDGHCDWEREPVSVFDRRPPHHLEPLTLTVDVTDAVRTLGEVDAVTVTLHAAYLTDPTADGVLRFEQLSLHAYT